ncbi:MAG: DMT family transporter [Desulfovibrio sp.]
MTHQKSAYIAGLSAVAIWSTVATAFKLALAHLAPLQLLFIATISSSIALLGVLAFQKKLYKIKHMSTKEVLKNCGLGFINPFLYYVTLFKAYELLPAQEAQALNYTWAITLTLLSVPFLGHKITLKDAGAICLSYFGVLLIATHGAPLSLHFSNGTGAALALGSTIIWAGYWIINARNTGDPVAGLTVSFLFSIIPCTAAMLYFDPITSEHLSNASAMLSAGYVGFFEMGITFVLWLTALKLTESTAKISNLIFLSPILSLVLIHFILGEEILSSTIWGLGCILGGNAIQQLKAKASHS